MSPSEHQRRLEALRQKLQRAEQRQAKRKRQIEAMQRLLALMAPYAKINPDITVEEVMKLEQQRILDALEKDLKPEG